MENIKEIRIKSSAELSHLVEDLKKRLAELKFKAAQKQLKNIREIREIKKDIARILTVIKERTIKK